MLWSTMVIYGHLWSSMVIYDKFTGSHQFTGNLHLWSMVAFQSCLIRVEKAIALPQPDDLLASALWVQSCCLLDDFMVLSPTLLATANLPIFKRPGSPFDEWLSTVILCFQGGYTLTRNLIVCRVSKIHHVFLFFTVKLILRLGRQR